jgi:mRNA interferase MazF
VIRQGEIYLADLDDAGRRPILVVSREALNRGRYVVFVTFTTARLDERRALPNCVFFRRGEFGLTADCVAQCETIAGTEIERLDATPIGEVDDETLRNVIRAIGNVIGSECEPT